MKHLLLLRERPSAGDEDGGARTGVRAAETLLEGALHDPEDATTLRRRDGELMLEDGPFADFDEPVVAFALVEAPDLEAAVAVAAAHPAARSGAVEVRTVWEGFADDEPGAVPAPGTRPYLLLHANPRDRDSAPPEAVDASPIEWSTAEPTRRTVVTGHRLRPADAATSATVRVRQGEAVVVHGPYAELAEEVAGFDLLAARDLDDAIEVARTHPTLLLGAIEIRPLWT